MWKEQKLSDKNSTRANLKEIFCVGFLNFRSPYEFKYSMLPIKLKSLLLI